MPRARIVGTVSAALAVMGCAILINPVSASANEDTCTFQVNSTLGLNVRSGAGLSYPVIGTLQYGQIVKANGYASVEVDGYDWTRMDSPYQGGDAALDFMTKLSCP